MSTHHAPVLMSGTAPTGNLVVTMAPGTGHQWTITDTGTGPVRVGIGLRSMTPANGCQYSGAPAWASVSPHALALVPGESQSFSVRVASSGPAGKHDVSVQATDLTHVTHVGNGAIIRNTVAGGLVTTYPGAAPAPAPTCLRAASVTAPPAHTSGLPVGLLAGGAGLFLALVLAAVVGLRFRRKHRRGPGRHLA
jgi:hypothetical protein